MIRTPSFVSAWIALASLIAWTGSTRQEPSIEPALKSEPTYPTFAPFTSSRMFSVLIGDPATLDFEAKAKELDKLVAARKAAKDAVAEFTGKKPDGPSAFLEPRVPDAARTSLPLLPAALMKLEPLWGAGGWSPEQLAAAQDVARFVATLPNGPELSFVAGKQADNGAELRSLVEWYRSQIAKPELYAAMIATFDDGPFAGLPYEPRGPLEPVQTLDLGEKVKLHLCRVDRPKEPFVLQVLRDKKVLWSRVVSGGPDESVRKVELRGQPQDLGDYGWKVFLTVAWSQGVEAGYLYLDADGKLLFYFLSW